MNRNIPVQVAYDRTNKGVDVRNPSTANFLIDSEDRAEYNQSTVLFPIPFPVPDPFPFSLQTVRPTASDFSITKLGQNLISGFFTRLAMTEIEIQWSLFNVRDDIFLNPDGRTYSGNNETEICIGQTAGNAVTNFKVSISPGNYTVKQALDALLVKLNVAQFGLPANLFTLVDSQTTAQPVYGKKALQIATGYFFSFYRATPVPASPAPFVPNLAQSLGFNTYDVVPATNGVFQSFINLASFHIAFDPNLLPYNYIDITSPQLASQQKVKDATTSTFDSIDVIYRWVFANDEADPTAVDEYNYPILQGYYPFKSRRYLSFPKQVRWDPLLPIGNLQFQTYTDLEKILRVNAPQETFEFKMLMLVSEV
jgi:hypothetical protein